MQNIKLTRRQLAFAFGSGLVLSSYPLSALSRTLEAVSHPLPAVRPDNINPAAYVSAMTDRHQQHWLATLDTAGNLLKQLALPSRAHQIATHPELPIVAAAARRPGTYLMIVNSRNGQLIHALQPEPGHHFYGHATYSLDGHFLYTTENHIDSGEGRIFVRDTRDQYKVIRSFSSQGIGPHELKVHPDGQTLVVANGGILTHPDKDRDKLNLDSMSPSLVYLSCQTGALLEQCKLPEKLHQLSIRHIDINHQGVVAIAMQYQGHPSDKVPLIARHERGKTIETLRAPEQINLLLKNYCGSVCFNQSGSLFAVTAPRGNAITLWSAADGSFIRHFRCRDVCGISQADEHGFIFSNGSGKLYVLDANISELIPLESTYTDQVSWDNHLSRLG